MSNNEQVYLKGTRTVDNDLDIKNILRTMNKLKAGLQVLIENDKKLIHKWHKYYIENTTIYPDSCEEHCP